jgi:hypothetical protein
MTDSTGRPEDERLLAELRRLAREVDPVPDEVAAYAQAALGWRRVDAELAELLADSALEGAPALTRGVSQRTLRFAALALTVHVEVHEQDARRLLVGQLDPPEATAIEAQRDDGTTEASTVSDERGRFRLELQRAGRLRLHIPRDPPAVSVETSWFDL